jgi:hypothetical protein
LRYWQNPGVDTPTVNSGIKGRERAGNAGDGEGENELERFIRNINLTSAMDHDKILIFEFGPDICQC